MIRRRLDTPLGMILLVGTSSALCEVQLHPDEEEIGSAGASQALDLAAAQFREYFDGNRTTFDVPLNPSGTDFQRSVWDALLEIPYGETCSYVDIARRVGCPNGSRAVGQANGRNPISIIVPCHRVVAANGGLGGYTGGLPVKRWLLDHEAKVNGFYLK